MSDAFVFDWMARTRQNMLKYLDRISEEHIDIIPEDFNNNIHWQFGHIVTIADSIIYGFAGQTRRLPVEYSTFFAPNTRPSEWHGEPPSWEDVLNVFNSQVDELREVFGSKLDESVAVQDNFAGAKIIHDLLELNLTHEAAHSGMINAMTRLLRKA
ncbi:DinB family protein [Paenibacillus kandeliae]|uniref:DinB family protein n=1 Tax=Paenibacillus kandeliae TaxID=3231269 RepID=UPI00345AE100